MPHIPTFTTASDHRGRTARGRVVAITCVAVAAVLAALALPGAAGAAGSGLPHATTAARPVIAVAGHHYSRLEPLCGQPKSGQMACFAVRRAPVSVKPGTALPDGVQQVNAFGNGAAGGYSPSDLESLYGFSRSKGGKGQTIALVDWFNDPSVMADLNHFDHTYGFPAETAKTFRVVNQNGAATPLPPNSSTSRGGSDTTPEISLDVQSARAVCAGCKIVLVEATAPSDADLATAENSAVKLGATEISNSFGGAESSSVPPSFVKAFNHPGVVITASTGDNGWFSWDFANNMDGSSFNVANTPSTLRTVVSVGGTTLADTGKQATVVRKSETVWNENGPHDEAGVPGGAQGGTGGGCSSLFKAEPWQRHAAGFSKTGCGKQRLAADVSAIADPNTGFDVFDSDDGLNFFTVGGTSLSSPVVAAMWGLAGGAHHVRYPALTLYGNERTHPSTLHDVVVGGNGFCDGTSPAGCESEFAPPRSPNTFGLGILDCGFKPNSATVVTANHQCEAVTGFDGPSGVGTPAGLKVFKALFPSGSIKATKLRAHRAAKFKAKVRDPFPGGGIATYTWKFGDGGHSHKAHPKHSYSKARAYTVKLTVTDVYGLKHTIRRRIHVKH
jgi:hypothetical protein